MTAPERRPTTLPPGMAGRLASVCDRFESEWLAGRRPRLEDFLAEVADPDRAALVRELLDLDLHYRARHGDRTDAAEYVRRLPGYEPVIDRVFARPAPTPAESETPTRAGEAADGGRPPLRAGRYAIQGEIGRGGMGEVWRAHDPDLGRTLAVKVLRRDHRGQSELERRFRAEAQITGRLQHPGIPPVHEVGTLDDGRPFLAMKLIEGRTLDDLLRDRRTPADELPRFLGIFEQVCQTLAYAHSKGVIHRDLKPANVMVGAFGEVQVMDWGLARARGGASPAPREMARAADTPVPGPGTAPASQEGDVIGTPGYLAPEQARGEVERLDERCDVFGLGAVLCEVLTGAPPFRGPGLMDVLTQAAAGDVADAFGRLDGCGADGELVRLTKVCLAADRGARPAHGGAVAEAVAAYLAGVRERLRQAELARAQAQARAEGERKRRRLTAALAAAVLAGVGVAAGAWAWVTGERATRLDREAQLARADRERAERRAETTRSAEAELRTAEERRHEAREAPDENLEKWNEALAALRRAEGLLAGGEADPEVRARRRTSPSRRGRNRTTAWRGRCRRPARPRRRRCCTTATCTSWRSAAAW
jgi:serine/threonine-protein kinase